MSRLTLPTALAVCLLLLPIQQGAGRVIGCAVAPPPGVHISIGEESAIIVWDAESKTQHFIRRATFQTEASDFGFLVPTPTRPTLAEADDRAFQNLAWLTAPQVRHVAPPSGGCGCEKRVMYQVGAPAGKVEVLEEKSVAGYDAAVLAATDAQALNKWLAEHGYESGDVLRKWLEPYVAQKWIVTAFKVARDRKADPERTNAKGPAAGKPAAPAGEVAVAGPVTTSAVRMTFQTDRPFFPYREPEDQRTPGAPGGHRMLRVFFIGSERMEGTLGENGGWNGTVAYSKPIPESNRNSLTGMLKLSDAKSPTVWWLTEFEDRSSPRPGTDEVYFRPAADQTEVERPAVTMSGGNAQPVWPTFLLGGIVLAGWLSRKVRRATVARVLCYRPC